MREIKFRAWNKVNKRMLQNAATVGGNIYWDHGRSFSVFCEEYEIMQYTGLKDKTGREIYEGDVIEFDKREWYGPFVVNFDDQPPHRFVMKWGRDGWSYDGGCSDLSTHCEVIGNIYENPELLDGVK